MIWQLFIIIPTDILIKTWQVNKFFSSEKGSRTNTAVLNVGVDKRRSLKRRSGQTQEC